MLESKLTRFGRKRFVLVPHSTRRARDSATGVHHTQISDVIKMNESLTPQEAMALSNIKPGASTDNIVHKIVLKCSGGDHRGENGKWCGFCFILLVSDVYFAASIML